MFSGHEGLRMNANQNFSNTAIDKNETEPVL